MSPTSSAKSAASHPIFTLGYEGLNLDEFTRILRDHKVQAVVDVRATALSHKPGFSKTSFQKHMEAAGFHYFYFPGLGIPKSVRESLPDRPALWKHYETELLPSHPDDLKLAAKTCLNEPCVLVCFEHDAADCHRGVLAKLIARRNHCEVVHLTGDSEPRKMQAKVERVRKSEVTRRPHNLVKR
jgi:uncharacterized protein (DUF488 family)